MDFPIAMDADSNNNHVMQSHQRHTTIASTTEISKPTNFPLKYNAAASKIKTESERRSSKTGFFQNFALRSMSFL